MPIVAQQKGSAMTDKSPSLINILQDLDLALDKAQGEVTDEIAELFNQLIVKSDHCALFRDYAKSRAEFLRNKAREFTDAARQVENTVSRFEDYLKKAVIEHGELTGETFTITVHNGPESVVIDETAIIPTQAQKLTVSPDKTKLREMLNAGTEIPGVRLEKSVVLKIKPRKGV